MDRREALKTAGAALFSAAVAKEAFAAPAEAPMNADPLRAVENAQQAADRYGVDAWSSDPANWDVKLPTADHKDAYAHMATDPSGEHHRVKLGDGTVAEYSMDIHSSANVGDGVPGDNRTAITFVAKGKGLLSDQKVVEVRGGTFREFDVVSTDEAAKKLLGQVKAKEAIEQPGVLVLPVGFSATEACR